VASAVKLAAPAGAGIAALGIVGVALGDGPYLSLSELSPWLVLWAVGLFVLLGCAPFALHARIAAGTEDRDRRWELAVVAWGGVALVGVAGFGVISLLEGFEATSALGAIALVGLAECCLVVASVAAVMLTTG
jgi:hypothetical protein